MTDMQRFICLVFYTIVITVSVLIGMSITNYWNYHNRLRDAGVVLIYKQGVPRERQGEYLLVPIPEKDASK